MRQIRISAADLYGLKIDEYNRFPEQNHCIYRSLYDPNFKYYHQTIRTGMEDWVDSGESGFSRVELAYAAAAWTINKHMPFAYDPKPEFSPQDYFPKPLIDRPPDPIPAELLTQYVKKASLKFGASLVGIAEIDRNWLYSTKVVYSTSIHEKQENQFPIANIPEEYKYAIVIAVEMGSDGFRCAPNFLEFGAAGWGYSQMSIIIASLAQFLRFLGYRAIPCANDTGLSIPFAIDAGLGALGRIGLLITKEFGPRVRLCKVLTDASLIPDMPNKDFIEKINNTCRTCTKCADACEMDAINKKPEPDYESISLSNNPGIRKWYVDAEKCYGGWMKYSTDCGLCIRACPFSRIGDSLTPDEFWCLGE